MQKAQPAHVEAKCPLCKGMAGPNRGVVWWNYIMGGTEEARRQSIALAGQGAQGTTKSGA